MITSGLKFEKSCCVDRGVFPYGRLTLRCGKKSRFCLSPLFDINQENVFVNHHVVEIHLDITCSTFPCKNGFKDLVLAKPKHICTYVCFQVTQRKIGCDATISHCP